LAGWDNVTVVIADALNVPLPHRRFRVVANNPVLNHHGVAAAPGDQPDDRR
jgi:hypothetical protein